MAPETATLTTRATIAGALRTTARLIRARWAAVLVAMLCVQGALLWTMPLLVSLMRWTLRQLGIDGANLYTLDTLLTSPLALLVLVGIAVVATLFVLAEITLFAVIAHLALAGEPVTFGNVLRRARSIASRAIGWQGLLLVPYLTVLLPISQVGFSSVLTEHVALPRFISGELLKTTSGTVLYTVVMGAIVYGVLRLLLFPALLAGGDVSILGAMRRSVRMTTWRPLLGFGAILLATLLAASLVMVVLGAIGLVPVAAGRTATVSGVVVGLLDLARFVVAGASSAVVAFFLVCYLRLAGGQPVEVTAPAPAGRRTRAASAVLVVAALLIATPRVVASAEAANVAAEASPEIIGHRGYPDREVENSIEGLHAAADAGADVVETDIQETRDGGLVVMHDVGLERMTGDDRDVYELTEEEVTGLTLSQGGRTAQVPTLAEYVRAADARGVRLLVEVKPHGQEREGHARRLAEEMDRLDPDHTHMIQSLDRELIEEITRIDPDRRTAYVVGFQVGELPATITDAVVIENWSLDDRMLEQARAQGRELYVWTVNDLGPLRERLAGGADAVITDDVGLAAETRERLAGGPVALYLELASGLVAVDRAT
ncbi:glycerophosphodiester phosphodiesterase family protein [Georgenia sp. Z1344]|uniref:glycerophosphodiester phosphodiesterase family protein n=1 Tax=Georgenia sp. Z1344 TaxID=3416706 RepID=UPI003CEBB638